MVTLKTSVGVAEVKNQQENSSRFLDAFVRIEKELRRYLNTDNWKSFVQLVKEAAERGNRIAKMYQTDLREFADLRNAIVHNQKKEVIAEPHLMACEMLEKIADQLTNPPRVFDDYNQPVETVDLTDSIGNAVRRATSNGFSQLPVVKNGKVVGLLTSNTVMRWLGESVKEEILSVVETSVSEILEYTEYQEHVEFLGREATLFDVIELFGHHDQNGRRLEAVIITHDGRPDQKPLGIVTHWDLPEIYRKLSIR